jgi:hypothetical protein
MEIRRFMGGWGMEGAKRQPQILKRTRFYPIFCFLSFYRIFSSRSVFLRAGSRLNKEKGSSAAKMARDDRGSFTVRQSTLEVDACVTDQPPDKPPDKIATFIEFSL